MASFLPWSRSPKTDYGAPVTIQYDLATRLHAIVSSDLKRRDRPLLSLDNPASLTVDDPHYVEGHTQPHYFYEEAYLIRLLLESPEGKADSPGTGIKFTWRHIREVRILRDIDQRNTFLQNAKQQSNRHHFQHDRINLVRQDRVLIAGSGVDPRGDARSTADGGIVKARNTPIHNLHIIHLPHGHGFFLLRAQQTL